MIFRELELSGAYEIGIEKKTDDRGFFARTWCSREFAPLGLTTAFVQGSISVNEVAGTLRGLHFQQAPHGEAKLIRCTRGAIYDVVVDLRPGSPSFLRWVGLDLTATSYRALYIPAGIAHGFQTLHDNTEIFYEISDFYEPSAAAGIRHDDPSLGIPWPKPVSRISAADRSWPTLAELDHI